MAARGAAGRRRVEKWLGPVVAMALLVPMGLVVWRADADRWCWDVPPEVAALADDPAAATAYLDPGPVSGESTGAVAALLAPGHWVTCDGPAGPDLLGAILVAATTGQTLAEQDGPAVPHTPAMASVAHETVVVLAAEPEAQRPPFVPGGGARSAIPPGLEPYLGLMLAAYLTDLSHRTQLAELGDVLLEEHPVRTLPDPETGEARVLFATAGELVTETDPDSGEALEYWTDPLRDLTTAVASHPEGYAVLYDAHLAYAAHCLDLLTVDEDGKLTSGTRAAALPNPTDPFAEITGGVAGLSVLRDALAEEGVISDGAAFDAAVREHSRGVHLATAEPPGEPSVLAGALARRAPAGPAGDAAFLDGRAQLLMMLEDWAGGRGLPEQEWVPLRAALASSYHWSHRFAFWS
ncbi:hypothetical protein [Streptomyces sp. AA0539]|uniref:hypothetical protein n=1 Tax=Streptomyces sp. AA0539 TaxID=1210045 RepID=UPI001319E09D|nr:hypothetical protein [Streptomyces sp. AA0539]